MPRDGRFRRSSIRLIPAAIGRGPSRRHQHSSGKASFAGDTVSIPIEMLAIAGLPPPDRRGTGGTRFPATAIIGGRSHRRWSRCGAFHRSHGGGLTVGPGRRRYGDRLSNRRVLPRIRLHRLDHLPPGQGRRRRTGRDGHGRRWREGISADPLDLLGQRPPGAKRLVGHIPGIDGEGARPDLRADRLINLRIGQAMLRQGRRRGHQRHRAKGQSHLNSLRRIDQKEIDVRL